MSILTRVLELFLIGILIGILSIVGYLKINHRIKEPVRNVMIFRGELNPASTLPMLSKIISLPYGSNLDVYVDSPGGSIACLETLLLAIKVNNIHIHSYSVGPAVVASAAAIFFVQSDTMNIDPATIFVFHLGAICPFGEPCHKLMINSKDKMESYMAKSTAELNKIAFDRCLITKEQYSQIVKGEDVFVSGREVINNMKDCDKKPEKKKDTIPFIHYVPIN